MATAAAAVAAVVEAQIAGRPSIGTASTSNSLRCRPASLSVGVRCPRLGGEVDLRSVPPTIRAEGDQAT
jgi:hypothetical protein